MMFPWYFRGIPMIFPWFPWHSMISLRLTGFDPGAPPVICKSPLFTKQKTRGHRNVWDVSVWKPFEKKGDGQIDISHKEASGTAQGFQVSHDSPQVGGFNFDFSNSWLRLKRWRWWTNLWFSNLIDAGESLLKGEGDKPVCYHCFYIFPHW